MNNRFQNCKSLIDLHNTLCDESIAFESLSLEEAERLAVVFSANTDETIALPLSEETYVYMCAKARQYAIEVATNVLKNKFEEDSTMTKNIFKTAVDSAAATITQATEEVKVRAGMDTEEFKDRADESVTAIKDATMGVLGMLDHLVGASALKESLLLVMYKRTQGCTSKRGFFDAAQECRRIVYEYIDDIMSFDPDEEELKTVAALRYLIGENEDGTKRMGHRSIFTAFANGITWIVKKVARKLRSWFGVDAESNLFGAVGASISSICGMVTGVVTAAAGVAIHMLIFVGSYVATAVIKAISWVWDKLKAVGAYVKKKFSKEDEDIDFYEDEEEEEVILSEYEELK